MCATKTAPSVDEDMDKLTSDWFEELRKALNSSKRWKRALFSDDRLGTKIQQDYAKLRKHLLELEQCGTSVGIYQKEYDEIVKTAELAKNEKSPAGIKDALEKIKKLDEKLSSAKKKLKENLGKRSWNSTREEVNKQLISAHDDWLTQSVLAGFENDRKTILGSALRRKKVKGKFVPSDEDTQQELNDLLQRINQAISVAKNAAVKFSQDKSTAKQALSGLKKKAGPSDLAPLQDRYQEALTLVEDNNDYAGASKKLVKLATDISDKQQELQSAGGDYELAEKSAADAIARLKKVTSEAVCGRFESELQAAQRDAELGEYVLANKKLTKLTLDVDSRYLLADQAKKDWEQNPLRTEIKNKAKTYRQSRNENPYYALVANLDGELGVIEFTASKSQDYERAGRELLALDVSLKDRESKIDKLKRAGEPPKALKARTKMALEETKLSEALDALSEKLDGPDRPDPGDMAFIRTGDNAFRGRIAAIKLEVDKAVIAGDPKAILAAYQKAADDYKQLAEEVIALKDDDQKLDKYKEDLKNERETRAKIVTASKAYDKAKTLAGQDLLRLEDTGGEKAKAKVFRSDFDEFSKPGHISNNDPATDLDEYAQKFTDLSTDIKKVIETNAQQVQGWQNELKESIKKVTEACKKHSDEKKFCAQINTEVDKLKTLVESQNKDVLEVGKGQAQKLLVRANSLDDPTRLQELKKQRGELSAFKKSLKNKDLKKYVPNTRADLKSALADAEKLVYSGESAVAALKELTDKMNAANTAAGEIKKSRKALDKKLKEIDGSLKELGKKIVEHAKSDPKLKGKDIKGKSFGDYQTKLDTINVTAKGENPKLYEDAIKLADELIDDLPSDPAGLLSSAKALANNEGTQIEKDKREREEFQWDFRTVLNGVFKEAKEYAEQSKDKDGVKLLEKLRDNATKTAEKPDYKAARNLLTGLERQATNMLDSPVGVNGAKKLEPLKAAWLNSLKTCRAKLKKLAAEIAKETDIQSDAGKLDDNAKAKLVTNIRRALVRFRNDAFADSIDKLINDKDPAVRLAAREKGLTRVRKYQRRLHEDPVMRVLNRKAFGVQVPLKSIHDVLNRLDVLLQINN